MILAAADGKSNSQIARALKLCVDTVRAWRGRWLEPQAILLADLHVGARLVDLPRPEAPARITAEQTRQLFAIAREQPKERPISQWTGREIAVE
jgi:transposase